MLLGSLINVAVYTAWTLLYTAPRWHELVVEPIYGKDVAQPSVEWAIFAYALHAVLVGVHTMAFFKSVRQLGAVPVAISKGAQQAGIFVAAHLIFCRVDRHECMYAEDEPLASWARWQKPLAILICTSGVVVYMLGDDARPPPPQPDTLDQSKRLT